MKTWTDAELDWLKENYPALGKQRSAEYLDRGEGSVRWKAYELGLRLNRESEHWRDFQRRAAQSKVGKSRPEQAEVMRRNHRLGKLLKTQEQRAAISRRMVEWMATHEHPRGMAGKKHSMETRLRLSEVQQNQTQAEREAKSLKAAITRAQNQTSYTPRERTGTTWKGGRRTIGGVEKYYRSRWEANYARWLEWLRGKDKILKWEHEPETFWFEGVRRGAVSYLPDFRVTNLDGSIEYHEVKGWMDKRSQTKIRRMAKYHPNVTLLVIDGTSYRSLAKSVAWMVEGWEF